MKFSDLLEECSGFEIVPEGEQLLPLGVTEKLLWNLWDIVVKQGENFYGPKVGIQIRQGEVALEAYDFRGNGYGGSAGLSVFYHEKGKRFQSTSGGAFFFHLKNGLVLIWDRRVTLEIAQTFVQTIDQVLLECGELTDGVRAQCREDFIFWKNWQFRGHRVVSAPDFTLIPHVWKVVERLNAAEQGI
jgi:hypothetical protein